MLPAARFSTKAGDINMPAVLLSVLTWAYSDVDIPTTQVNNNKVNTIS